jgi:DNA-binding PadR family transcriptional regulator
MAAGVETSKTRYIVNQVDDRLLRAVFAFHFLTVDQATRLLYAKGSKTYVSEALKRLTDAGFLQKGYLPRPGSQGRARALYELSRRGLHYLEEQGIDTSLRARPSKRPYHAAAFDLHTLAVNDVLIAARLLEKQTTQVQVAVIRHERDLKKTASVQITTDTERADKRVYVVPDGWIDFRTPSGGQYPIWLELDRGTEGVKKIKQKVRSIVAYYTQGHYERHFHTKKLRCVAFVVDHTALPGKNAASQRVAQLTRWIGEELKEQGKSSWHKTFAVGVLADPPDGDPRGLFCAPVFQSPGVPSPISLLDLPRGPAPRSGMEHAAAGFP